MREATEKLITGRGTMSFDDAAGIYIYSNARRHIGNTATNRFMAEATKVSGEFRAAALNDMIDVAETQGGTALNALFAGVPSSCRTPGSTSGHARTTSPTSSPSQRWSGSARPRRLPSHSVRR